MKILVTGGAGFIGSTLSDALIARGDSVVVIDSFNDYYDPAIKRANVSALLDSPNFTLHEFDIRDALRVSEVMATERPEVIVHIAARAGVRPSIDDPVLYEEVNGLGTLNIVEAAKAIGLKNFVFASSSSVYGLNSKVPFSESDPVTCPISPYAATKRANELMLYTYSHLYNIPVTCLRFFTVYGERGRPDMAIAKFTALIDEGRPIPVYGDGSAIRDFTYIGDIIDGVVGAIDTPHAYEIINIGGSKTVELRRVIEIIETKLGKRAEIDFMDKFPGDVPVTSADVTKAREMIGFDPKVGIEEGIGRYIDWYLSRKEGSG
jgi:UDP-glucuronate 4-epimerase